MGDDEVVEVSVIDDVEKMLATTFASTKFGPSDLTCVLVVIGRNGRGKKTILPGARLTVRPDGKLDAARRHNQYSRITALEKVYANEEKRIAVRIVCS